MEQRQHHVAAAEHQRAGAVEAVEHGRCLASDETEEGQAGEQQGEDREGNDAGATLDRGRLRIVIRLRGGAQQDQASGRAGGDHRDLRQR